MENHCCRDAIKSCNLSVCSCIIDLSHRILRNNYPFSLFCKLQDSRPPRLVNLGNSCYLNAALQLMLSIEPLIRQFSTAEGQVNGVQRGLLATFNDISRWPSGEAFQPADLLDAALDISIVCKDETIGKMFRPGRQEDVHEFLVKLFDELDETGAIKSFLSFQMSNKRTCSNGNCAPSYSSSNGRVLPLPITDAATLEDSLDSYMRKQSLEGFKCERCFIEDHSPCSSRESFFIASEVPEFMVFTLMRYTDHGRTKIDRHVGFPLNGLTLKVEGAGRSPTFKLITVIEHRGNNLECGHYVAYTLRGEQWYECNDDRIREISQDAVTAVQAYILLYKQEEICTTVSLTQYLDMRFWHLGILKSSFIWQCRYHFRLWNHRRHRRFRLTKFLGQNQNLRPGGMVCALFDSRSHQMMSRRLYGIAFDQMLLLRGP